MDMDSLFDQMEKNPIRTLLMFWLGGALIGLVALVIAIVVIVLVLTGLGVL